MPRSSVTPFTYYTFRYDYTDTVIRDKICEYFIREFARYAIFDEVSDKVEKHHIQGKIGKCMSDEQIRKNIRKVFPKVFDKSNYSIAKIKDPDAYDSYICKGGKVLCNNVFTPEYIDAQVEKHKSIVEDKDVKRCKLSSPTFTQSVFMDFKKDHFNYFNHIRYANTYRPDEGEILHYEAACEKLLGYILKRLGNVVKVFDDTVLQRMYTGIKTAILMDGVEENSVLVSQYKKRIQL